MANEQTGIPALVAKVMEKLEKAGKVIFKPTDNRALIPHILTQPGFTYSDWSNDAEGWNGVLLVKTKGKKGEQHVSQTRAVSFPGMDEVFSDQTMRGVLYDRYISMLAREASHPEAEEAAFKTLTGPWAEEGRGAYNFQAETWVNLLCMKSSEPEKMAKALNTRTLRLALESAEYAKSHFPGLEGKWGTILNVMRVKAMNEGYSPAQIDHWIATRDLVADTKKITVSLDDNTEALLGALGAQQKAA